MPEATTNDLQALFGLPPVPAYVSTTGVDLAVLDLQVAELRALATRPA